MIPSHTTCGRALALLAVLRVLGGTGARAEVVSERIGDGIARFFASAEARRTAPPSLALQAPLPALGALPEGFAVQPVFQVIDHRPAARIDIQAGTSIYGTGEVPGPLLRNGLRTTCWNTDAWGYGAGTLSLYQSHPWVLAVRADGSAFGVLADTSWRCHVDLGSGILFIADGPAFPVLVIDRGSPQAVVTALRDLTGPMPLPPAWALGYHQCRWSYETEARVRQIAAGFRDRDIPCDGIWLDIDHMEDFRSFTFSAQRFPEPERLLADLRREGFHTVAIVDPGLQPRSGWSVYDSGTERDAWVKSSSGAAYLGKVWPGTCVFPDFTRRAVRDWWASLTAGFAARGVDGVWNDMNEPSIFEVATKTMPLDVRHDADAELGGPDTHARYHNVYGLLMARATWEGLAGARPEARPFVLTRAGFLGGQRWAATWTGDNQATWEHLGFSIPMVLNLGLSGQPFAGPDIGGFARAGDARLFARWMGIGALLPFARGHTEKNNIDKEPWAFGPEVERTCRQALGRRYRLLPYLYTLFEEASRTGLPVARPLFFADAVDPALRSVDDAFLLGPDLLVAAAVEPEGGRESARPRGIWRPFDLQLGDGENPELPAVALRGGAIVPIGPAMEFVGERPTDPLQLVVCLDDSGRAEGLLYEDEGDGYGHLSGRYRRTRFAAEQQGGWVTIESRVEAGELPEPPRRLEVRLLLADREVEAAGSSAERLRLRL